MSTRLCSLLGVEWKGFAEFAEEGSEAGIEARLKRFHELAVEAAGGEEGELVQHPVKDRSERKLFVFAGPSACVRTARELLRTLGEGNFEVAVGMHAGECFERGGTVVGTPVREVAALTDKAVAKEILATEVFRLTAPVELGVGWSRREPPVTLAGTPWVLFDLSQEEGA